MFSRRNRALSTLIGVLMVLAVAPAENGSVAARGRDDACFSRLRTRRELTHGRFLDHRWSLSFYRDAEERPCLTDEWSAYGSIFRFRLNDHRPRLGILNLAAASPPRARDSAYVMEGYLGARVAELTFRIAGRTDDIEIVRSPDWAELPKDLFIHLVAGKRFDRDRTGWLRAYDANGDLIAARRLRRTRFIPEVKEG